MSQGRALATALTLTLLVVSCGGGDGGGSSTPTTPTPPTPTVTNVTVLLPSGNPTPGQTAQAVATATLSNGTSQTVTSQATWESSNTAVATISNTGLVTTVTAGQTEIRATYQSVRGATPLTVASPPPPAQAVTGTVREVGTTTSIGGATVSVKDTTFSAVTDSSGRYSINGVPSGNYTLRATASGFELTERNVTVSGGVGSADINMLRSGGGGGSGVTCPASSIPATATCIGNGTPPVTAVCNDGAYSCSSNRSGTCSTHGGVKCWVCPGALCNGLTFLTPPQMSIALAGR